jgi:hypothetical protein
VQRNSKGGCTTGMDDPDHSLNVNLMGSAEKGSSIAVSNKLFLPSKPRVLTLLRQIQNKLSGMFCRGHYRDDGTTPDSEAFRAEMLGIAVSKPYLQDERIEK